MKIEEKDTVLASKAIQVLVGLLFVDMRLAQQIGGSQ